MKHAEDIRTRFLDLTEKIVLNELNPENGARIKYLVDLHRQDEQVQAALADLNQPRHWWIKTLGFPFSMIGRALIASTRLAAETVIWRNIPGAMIETGVWRGGACIMMKAVMSTHGISRPHYV